MKQAKNKRIGQLIAAVRMGLHLAHLLYVALLSRHPVRFSAAVILNFMGRLFSLAAFVVSIQAIYIAFQSSISHGGMYKGKSYVDQFGFPEDWLPWVLAASVAAVFAMPAVLKRFETRLIAQIAKENHAFAADKQVMLLTDLFVTQKAALLMTYMTKLFSGLLFILSALTIVALFRLDLFFLVLGFSMVVGAGVIAISLHNIINLQAQLPLRSDYVTAAQYAHDPKRKQKLHLVRSIRAPAREQHFRLTLNNWAASNRAVFNQAIFTGFAIAAVVLFVFRLDDMDGFQLFLLLYLVIAIRYALNTARETGMMASKVLEARVDLAPLTELFDARKGRAPSAVDPAEPSAPQSDLLDPQDDLLP